MLPPMSHYHTLWMLAQAAQDRAMLTMFGVALTLAATWLASNLVPINYRDLARFLFIVQVSILVVVVGGQLK